MFNLTEILTKIEPPGYIFRVINHPATNLRKNTDYYSEIDSYDLYKMIININYRLNYIEMKNSMILFFLIGILCSMTMCRIRNRTPKVIKVEEIEKFNVHV